MLTIKDHDIEIARRFKHLGAIIDNTNDETEEIKARILADNKAYSSLPTIYLNKFTKIMTEQMLCTYERRILRRIYGPIQDTRCWCPRWNSDIYNLYKVLNIMGDINIRKLGWAGHIIRMEDERFPKKVLHGKFHNTRPVGKLRTRSMSPAGTHHRS